MNAPRILFRKVSTVFLGPYPGLDYLKAYTKTNKKQLFCNTIFRLVGCNGLYVLFSLSPVLSPGSSLSLSLSLSRNVQSLDRILETTFSDQRIGLVRFDGCILFAVL